MVLNFGKILNLGNLQFTFHIVESAYICTACRLPASDLETWGLWFQVFMREGVGE